MLLLLALQAAASAGHGLSESNLDPAAEVAAFRAVEQRLAAAKRRATAVGSWASPKWTPDAAYFQSSDRHADTSRERLGADVSEAKDRRNLAFRFARGEEFGRYTIITSEKSRPLPDGTSVRRQPGSSPLVGNDTNAFEATQGANRSRESYDFLEANFHNAEYFARYTVRVSKQNHSDDFFGIGRYSGPARAVVEDLASRDRGKPGAEARNLTSGIRIGGSEFLLRFGHREELGRYGLDPGRERSGRRAQGNGELPLPRERQEERETVVDRDRRSKRFRGTEPSLAGRQSTLPEQSFDTKDQTALAKLSSTASSNNSKDQQGPSLRNRLEEQGLQTDLSTRVQSFVAHTRVSTNQPFNFQNNLAKLPVTEINTELRPQINLAFEPFDVMLKPRLRFQWDKVEYGENGSLTTASEDVDAYLLEGRARMVLWNRLFLSYGREVLLWGPAMYITPSNPFFVTNNRANPYRELRGREYAKATYVLNNQWTASFISNLGLGLDTLIEQSQFRRIDALKVDYTGQATNASLVMSRRDDGFNRIGGYAQWTASDALLLYADATLGFGRDALYPRESLVDGQWNFSQLNAKRTEGIALVGGSYTTSLGPTLTVEYVHNSEGYGSNEAGNYFRAVDSASDRMLTSGAGVAGAARLLSQARSPGLSLLRKNYLFFQLLETNLADQLDVTIRYTHNLDDGSSELVPIFDWSVGSSTHLFALAQINLGAIRSEARRYVENQVFAGVNFTFD